MFSPDDYRHLDEFKNALRERMKLIYARHKDEIDELRRDVDALKAFAQIENLHRRVDGLEAAAGLRPDESFARPGTPR
jgi:hypothetical protein